MKTNIILIALFATLLAACNTDKVKTFIPGTYVNSAKGEYGQAEDTLIITPISGNAYLITQRTTYQAIRDGKLLRKHRKIQKLTGIYGPQEQVLNETTNGRIFIFQPEQHLLSINQASYHKIN